MFIVNLIFIFKILSSKFIQEWIKEELILKYQYSYIHEYIKHLAVHEGLGAVLLKYSTNIGLKGSLNIMFNFQQALMFTFLSQLIC